MTTGSSGSPGRSNSEKAGQYILFYERPIFHHGRDRVRPASFGWQNI